MAIYAVVQSDGLIINTVVIDDLATSSPPPDCSFVLDTIGMAIGGTYIDEVYTPPYSEPDEPLPVQPNANARLDAGIAAAIQASKAPPAPLAKGHRHRPSQHADIPPTQADLDALAVRVTVLENTMRAMLAAQDTQGSGA